ncbi:uncharacterized protein LOC117321908 isoform X2 [Pecten maximus]|uniref:uncharacterized protein LOC117321908 isoform X2 n=1 Tax=Pecten maximus TaxID=6579 RepID=UPI0014582B13|nr:uncharacterized protein LOC117321908 isoform X2 [Pecten maximus]
MDSSYVTAYIVVLIVFNILGYQSITGLTLCGNRERSRQKSRRGTSFPRSGICRGNPGCENGERKCSFAKLSCQSGFSIYNPVVQGLHTSETGSCTGLTPQIMQETSACYWNNMCTVAYPKVPMMIRHLDGDENCSGKCVNAVHVRSWQCVKNTMVHKMCDGTKDFVIDITNDVSRQGVVRSHEAWPYLSHAQLTPDDGTECNKTFYPHLLGVREGFTKLALSVVFLDIRPEFETLRAVSDGKTVEFRNNESPKVHVFPDAQTVVLSLKTFGGYNNDDDNRVGGAGFVICFIFVKRGENPSRDDVCRKVFRDNQRDAKCVNCKYKKGGKPIRDYCWDKQGFRVHNVTLARTKQTKDGCSPWTLREKPCKKRKASDGGGSNGNRQRKRKGKKGRNKGKKTEQVEGVN